VYEVELKVRAEHDAVREALSRADATALGTVHQRDTYYDAPDRDFAATDEALRVRHERGEESRTLLTYKGPLVDDESKTRVEHETAVADADELASILDGLGCAAAATVEKDRECYALEGYTVALDSVAGLGEFVEVEREVAAEAVERTRAGARALLTDLGLDPSTQVRTSYLGLLLDNREE
jgi:adenylate cyclase class 2